MRARRPRCLFALVVMLALLTSACQRYPLRTSLKTDKPTYALGETIVIEATVQNLRDAELAYCASDLDLFVYPVDDTGKRILVGKDYMQPDGTKRTIVSPISGGGPGGMEVGERFIRLSPRERRVFKREYVAKVPGLYVVTFHVFSHVETERLPDPNWAVGVFPGQPRPKLQPWEKERKVPNLWIGTVPEKQVGFEVRKPPPPKP